MATTVTRLRWQSAQALRGIGLPGWVALVLGVACAVGAWGLVEPLHTEAQRLDADSDALRLRAAANPVSTAAIDATPQQQLATFEQRFPGERGIAPSLARLQAAARRQGVVLDQAEFKFVSEPAELLARYSIILPVKADYRALRRFTRDALRELPGLAIEEVNLRRSDAKSALLEAQLRFVLFVTKPPSPARIAAVASAAAPSAN